MDNTIKDELLKTFDEACTTLNAKFLNEQIQKEAIDVSLPGISYKPGRLITIDPGKATGTIWSTSILLAPQTIS